MSECIKNCKLCPKLIISQSIVYNAGVNQLIIDLPAGSYGDCQKYCLVFSQAFPAATRLDAQVVFTIGGDQTVGYPFLNCDCSPIYASQVRTRRLYPTRVSTRVVGGGVFKYIGNCPLPSNTSITPASIPVVTANAANANNVATEVVATKK